jgi:hypothetical protein
LASIPAEVKNKLSHRARALSVIARVSAFDYRTKLARLTAGFKVDHAAIGKKRTS